MSNNVVRSRGALRCTMIVLETETPDALNITFVSFAVTFCIFQRLQKLRGKGWHLITTFCLPYSAICCAYVISVSSSAVLGAAAVYRWGNWGWERLNHSPSSHSYQVTTLCITYTQLITDFKVVDRAEKFIINAFTKKIFEQWLMWPSWMEHHLVNWKAVGSIPSQGTHLGYGFNPQLGCICRQLMNVSLSLRLPSSLCKSNEKVSLGENKRSICIIAC